jgi:hypothetical protein
MFAVYDTPTGETKRAKKKTIGFSAAKESAFVQSLLDKGNTNIHIGVRFGRIPKGELNRMTVEDTLTV